MATTALLRPNAALAYLVLDFIDAHPEQWDQDTYYHASDCGAAACFAGWAVMLAGAEIDVNGDVLLSSLAPEVAEQVMRIQDYNCSRDPEYPNLAEIPDVARALLGISQGQQLSLFDADNSRAGLGDLVVEFFGPRPQPTPSMAELLVAQDITNATRGMKP